MENNAGAVETTSLTAFFSLWMMHPVAACCMVKWASTGLGVCCAMSSEKAENDTYKRPTGGLVEHQFFFFGHEANPVWAVDGTFKQGSERTSRDNEGGGRFKGWSLLAASRLNPLAWTGGGKARITPATQVAPAAWPEGSQVRSGPGQVNLDLQSCRLSGCRLQVAERAAFVWQVPPVARR